MKSTYTMMDELMAHPKNPMPDQFRIHQLTRMWEGLASMESAPNPTSDDWRVCSDAVNLMETLIEMGVCEDKQGLLTDAVNALGAAGKRAMQRGILRLDGAGIFAVRSILEDYAAVLDSVSHRTMVRAHRLTEKRIQGILRGRKQPHDVEVVDL